MKTEKTVAEDIAAIADAKQNAHSLKDRLQAYLDQVHQTPGLEGSVNTITDLQLAISNIYEFCRQSVAAKIPDTDQETGLPINKVEKMKSLKMPVIGNLTFHCLEITHAIRQSGVDLMVYDVANGSVEVNEAKLDQYLDRFRLQGGLAAAETAEAVKQLAEAFNNVCRTSAKHYGENNTRPVLAYWNQMVCPSFDINRLLIGSDEGVKMNPELIRFFQQYTK